ncbi:MAG: preprotein translocase subunit SecG [Candidatus Caldatribacterium sp.]|uniref:preprotein translocase subunit SecG n=1 Tax=Candidatus Caldatribacterium sp. TaxID=2282143 RepID=UPI002997AB68|nr:preprotein translocase subunit SecG [Candidatus Caldatribacterium sp.]MCX7730093.1 preprotein translocase subunit SecG [Candidatus Caldatribacterium sp.]MDW8080479.1 preprotein translocase subunit SecG [Candidatus Calescibacterium sp.]
MEAWMVVQIVVSVILIFVVVLQPRKSGVGGGIFGGMTRADRSARFKVLPVLSRLTVIFGVALMVLSLVFSLLLAR